MDQGRRKFTWRGLETLMLDACLRPLGWSWEGGLFRRGLDGRTLEILKGIRSRWVDPQERDQLLAGWAGRLAEAAPGTLPATWLEDLERDRIRFGEIYQPISILPPDQYRAVVLQLAEGCPWNRCHFCDLYRDRRFRTMTLEEFARHLDEVIDYFGPSLEWRRGIFLGDANAGFLRQDLLVPALQLLKERFPSPSVSAFLDTFTGPLRGVEQWRILQQLGLAQLHLGVESGSPQILQLLGKPGQPARVVELVSSLKSAGIAVSLILMVGVGGKQGAAGHERQTLELLNRLPLERGDRIYLSELLVHPHSRYASLCQEKGLEEMTHSECREQAERIRAELTFPGFPEGPMVSTYDVRQFVYH